MPSRTSPPPGGNGKFAAPVFHPPKHLRRDAAGFGMTPGDPFPRFLFLEGQAGQGKTTLAAQLLAERPGQVCWYRLDEADQTAPYFLGALLTALKQLAPGFAPPAEPSILSGEVPREHAPRLLETLLADFSRCCAANCFLVLDDLHYCLPATETAVLLSVLLQHAPPRLHLLCLARRDLSPLVETARDCGPTLLLDSRMLAFTTGELAALFNGVWQVPLTRNAVKRLQQITGGWVMGLQLLARSLKCDEPAKIEEEFLHFRHTREEIFDYLLGQVLAELAEERRRALLVLSLLDVIPCGLAQVLTGRDTILAELDGLARENSFIYPLDDGRGTFVLHQLFQEGLRERLRAEQGEDEVRRLNGLAAEWFLEQGEPDRAIRFFLAANDYSRAEAVLRRAGLHDGAQHKLTGLWPEFGKLPAATVGAHPWFAYFHGLGLMGEKPALAYPFLQQAYSDFVRRGEGLGELLAGAQLMFFSVASDGHFARGYPLLDRSMALLDELADSLPPLVLGHVANIAVTANTFLRYNPMLAERFFDVGLDIARRQGLSGLEAEARVARLYYLIFSGAWQRCRAELEAALPHLHNPLCSQLHRGAILLAAMGYLKGSGDFAGYERYKGQMLTSTTARLRDSSMGEAYILFWDLQVHLARGERAEAVELLKRAELTPTVAGNPHQKNLFCQYAALLAAEDGRRDDALALIETARCLRREAGGLYYDALNEAFFGAAYDLLGEDEQALASFARAFLSPSAYLRETALAFRALFHHRRGDPRALDDLKLLFGSMRAADHSHFYGWMPGPMGELLAIAARAGIEPVFARQLAAQRLDAALLDDGALLPLLDITTLGALQLRIKGEVLLGDADLGGALRQLLGILLAQPTFSYPQKRLQLLLWPESSEIKSRNNFDKLLSRLRKTLESALGLDARHYLQLKNGILSLCHARVDSALFVSLVRNADNHLRRGEFWQAENQMHKAAALRAGEFLPSVSDSDIVEARRAELQQLFQSFALHYADILVRFQRSPQAIALLEQSLAGDPLHDDTVKKLYSFLILHDTPSRAQQVVERYGEALRREGFSPDEVRETLESFWG